MTSAQIVGIAASSAGMAIGAHLAHQWNKRHGENPRQGRILFACFSAFCLAVTVAFAFSY